MSPSHKDLLTCLTVLWHLAIALILCLASQLPSFDSSATPFLREDRLKPLLRWDVFHYAHIAQSGYVYEYEYAFFPGVPLIMKTGAILSEYAGIAARGSLIAQLFAGTLASMIVGVGAVHTLYDLTSHYFGSPHTAFLASLLSLLSSSPVTLRFAPYAEPFFTYFSYKGMLYCARQQFVRASMVFALAGIFRSNGTILSGYIVWGILVEPFLSNLKPGSDVDLIGTIRRVAKTVLLSSLPLLPFLWQQYAGYVQFCSVPSHERRPWCSRKLPILYSFAQSEYWGVGPFRYWKLQQSPNILLALPVLTLLLWGSISYLRRTIPLCVHVSLGRGSVSQRTSTTSKCSPDRFYSPSILPHAIHALVFSTILLTSAHTQIALRLVSALPFTYWTASRLFLCAPLRSNGTDHAIPDDKSNKTFELYTKGSSRVARWWIGWSMVWGAISMVTWGAFLPPA